MEIFTGKAMGQMQEDGTFPEDTVNHLVMKRLAEITESFKDKKDKDKEEEKIINEESASAFFFCADGAFFSAFCLNTLCDFTEDR